MIKHQLRVYPSSELLPKKEQLAYKLALSAADLAPINVQAQDMAINRIIDNSSVAVASINRDAVRNARAQALCHPQTGGATIIGMPITQTFSPEWATWANGTAVRELDFHDTFLAADYSHPGDNIPPLLAIGQTKKCSGVDFIRGIITAYEVQVNLVKAICLHKHKKDHVAHLGVSAVCGLGAMLKLDPEIIFQAINQVLHITFATRQSRKGEISSWKAYAPAFATKMAIESLDRAMRGEKAPSPIYEGEDSVIAWMLDGSNANYEVLLPLPEESKTSILETYTKEHSAEYQSQALIDLAFRLNQKISDLTVVESIELHTSHHTHYVIGTGSGDPQKFDPNASRETLDHSIMYIFAVALEDGKWHHETSYAPERAQRKETIDLWQKIKTFEDPEWTRLYHATNPKEKAFGARVEVTLKNGERIVDEIKLANAHPAGAHPFTRPNYIEKFNTLTNNIITEQESSRFLEIVQNLDQLQNGELMNLNIELPIEKLLCNQRDDKGLF